METTETTSANPLEAATLHLHALWGQPEVEQPTPAHIDDLLSAIKAHFGVATAMITVVGEDGSVVKLRAGPDPLLQDSFNALNFCIAGGATGGDGVFVLEDIPAQTSQPDSLSVRFYAGAPLHIKPAGSPVGTLCLMGTRPKVFSMTEQALFKSLASAVSAVLLMPHNPLAAMAIAVANQEAVLLIDKEQNPEAINRAFEELTGFKLNDISRTGMEQLLCLDRPHAGAMVLSHALLTGQPARAMTRCHTQGGGTMPVEVFAVPLPDKRGRTAKTLVLLLPLFSGSVENFLLSLRSTERSELLQLHIAGLWAVDAKGCVIKISGTPAAHLTPAALAAVVGKKLGDAGVFDAQTDWTEFYQKIAQGELPGEVQCCVTHNGQPQWYSMRGFRQTGNLGRVIGFHGSFRDITQSKLRELALKKSEQRLSLIVKGTNDGAWDWDMETGDYYLSPRWWAMMGRSHDSGLASAEVWMDFIHPDDREGVRSVFRNAVERRLDTYQSEFRLQHQRGHYIPVLGRGHILFNSSGKPVRTSGTNVDLTEQRQAQSQILLLKSCVESLQDVVIITHASPRKLPGSIIAYVNPAFEAFTGYSSNEVIGKTPRLLQGPLTSRQQLDKIAEAMRNWQPVQVELANYKKNGELFWAEIELTPVKTDGSDRFTHWIGVQRDITARKQAEQVLRDTTERLEMALDASDLGIWAQHIAKGQGYRDERWYAMLGYSAQEWTTSPFQWLELVHPDDVKRVQALEAEALKVGAPSSEKEFRMRHQDGRWVWIRSRSKVIERDAEGNPTIIAGTHLDVTAKVEARLLSERLNAQLLRCLGHLNVGVVLQRQGIIKFANPAMYEIFGTALSDDIVGAPFSDYILPGDIPAAVWRQQQLMAGAVLPSHWFNCIHHDGHTFKALTSSTVIEWDGQPHILSTLTPPSDMTMLAQEIESARLRYESLLTKKIEQEQIHIAHELHDSLGSQLAGISIMASGIKLMAESGEPFLADIDKLVSNVKAAAEMTRDLARGLAPVHAWPGAFWRALEKLCHDFSQTQGLQCEFDMQGDFDSVSAEAGNHLYRITQEAISNALRHGAAQHIAVRLARTGAGMTLTIQDDGTGFEVPANLAQYSQGIGLSSMYARTRAIGADITLQRTQPKGFCVTVTWQSEAV